jgi:hypothetical protein
VIEEVRGNKRVEGERIKRTVEKQVEVVCFGEGGWVGEDCGN